MTPGHELVSRVVSALLRVTAVAAAPSPPNPVIPDLPSLPPGIRVPPERTGQIVAAGMAIFLDLAGLTAVGVSSLVGRWHHRKG